jgi:hypothetical protein
MKRIIILFSFTAMVNFCKAQVAEGLTPLQRKQLTVLAEPATLYKGFFRLGYGIKYSRPGRTFDKNGVNRTPEDFNFSGNYVEHLFTATYGITDRIQISASLPYTNDNLSALIRVNQTNNQIVESKIKVKSKGISDFQTDLQVQLIKETKQIPAVVFGFSVWLPTGNNERTIVTDPVTFDVTYNDITGGVGSSVFTSIQVRKVMYPYLLAAEFKYFYGADGKIIENNTSIDVIGANSAVWQLTTGMHLNEWITITGKMFYQRLSFDSDVQPNTTVPLIDNSKKELLSFDPTLTFQFGRFRSQQYISIPISGKNYSSELEYSAGLVYTF